MTEENKAQLIINADHYALERIYQPLNPCIRHINPLMFDVIYDKPEGLIMYKHEPVGRGFIHDKINHELVHVL